MPNHGGNVDYTIKELAEISSTQHQGVHEAVFKDVEKILSSTFPGQYKNLLALVNAPEFFDWSFFHVSATDEHDPTATIVTQNSKKHRPRFLAPGYIAFAESNGDYLCFKVVEGTMEDAVYMHGQDTQHPEFVAPDLKSALLEIISYAEDDEDVEFLLIEEEDDDE